MSWYGNFVESFCIISADLISWCGNFVERHRFCIVSGESPKIMQKLPFHKISDQEIRWNFAVYVKMRKQL